MFDEEDESVRSSRGCLTGVLIALVFWTTMIIALIKVT